MSSSLKTDRQKHLKLGVPPKKQKDRFPTCFKGKLVTFFVWECRFVNQPYDSENPLIQWLSWEPSYRDSFTLPLEGPSGDS